jgi:hypothetical protein
MEAIYIKIIIYQLKQPAQKCWLLATGMQPVGPRASVWKLMNSK